MEERTDSQVISAFPQVKICGLTTVDDASACAELGANAIGLVFYPPSPRFVSDDQAGAICRALPESVWSVGVFVNEDASAMLRRVEGCGLRAVQLHGQEPPGLARELSQHGVLVIKALFANGSPTFDEAQSYPFSQAFLTECLGERLPGGNGRVWNWGLAADLGKRYPVILAGGLPPDNVGEAIRAADPAAVDVSSGVEASPGRKDLEKVHRFLAAVWRHRTVAGFPKVFR
ncbi:MAG TPA: phosphoribosylanthranilate isomerase [Syntrophobacteraceae bacterium]|nr:phosphoribosylanthranilate isomerase [Syntrophobacteraceae bacterium]